MKKRLGIALLCSVCLLSACQSHSLKEDKSRQSPSQSSSKKVTPKKSTLSEKTEVTSEQSSEVATEATVSASTEQVAETSSSSEAVQPVQGMDLSAIQANDYSSVAGTWQNGAGDILVFDANGIVGENTSIYNATIENNILTAGVSAGATGYAIVFLPAGSSETDDASDKTKDRIWGGQQANFSNPEAFYYKVD